MIEDWFDKGPREECGVFGVYAPGREAARLTFFGLYSLQHRGQESAGITTSDGRVAYMYKAMGLVSQVFKEDNLRPLKGHLAIGHNRYSTTGASHVRNIQPYLIETIHGPLGLAHNGNLTNALQLREALLNRGVGLSSTTDSEIITQILAAPPEVWNGDSPAPQSPKTADHWLSRIKAFMKVAEGAYSLTILTRNAIYAVRDPHGLRPLCLGKLPDGGYVVASESCALLTVGASFMREVVPGEIVRIDEDGVTAFTGMEGHPSLCIFEYVYFSRPDSTLEGQIIHSARQRMGSQLAREHPAEADIVVGVPDSATPASIGYSLQSGIPFTEALIKNRYIGRTFIEPDNTLRQMGVQLKYNPLTENLRNKRVVLVDDSIVRGNTAGPLIQFLRDAGAAEVHVRVSSPPVRHPCFMGVDMATRSQLIAHKLDVDEICRRIGANSLGYLSIEGMLNAVQTIPNQQNCHCTACFSGNYPIPIPEWLFDEEREKLIFEDMWG